MKLNVRLLVTALTVTLATLAGLAQETTQSLVTADYLATLKAFRSGYVTGALNGNLENLADYYAEDVRLMCEYNKTFLGKATALSYHKAFFSRFEVQDYTRQEIEVLDLGSRVVELGRFTLKLSLKRTGQKQQLIGKYQDIWEKSGTGGLKLLTEAWNYDHPVEMADALRFAELPAVQIALQGRVPVKDNISFELAALGLLLEKTVSQHDARLWSQFYTDDAIMIHSFAPLDNGKKAVDSFIENHVKTLPLFEKLDIRNDRIDVSGNYVVEYASHVANWRNGDSSGVSTGKNIRIWRREPDGALKIFRQIGMYD